MPQAVGLSDILPLFLLFLLLIAATGILVWRTPKAGYCALFFLGVLAPTSSFIPVVTQTMTEHRMYLPLAGVVALFVALLHLALGQVAQYLFILLAVILGVVSHQRNVLYQSDLALWQDTVAKRPDNRRAHLNLGTIHYREGRYAEAAEAYAEVMRIDPNLIETANNLGNCLMNLGRLEEAADHFELALTVLRGNECAVALNNHGNVLMQLGRYPEALARLQESVRLEPRLADAHYNLANVFTQSGRPLEALPHYEAALQIRADDFQAHGNYANALMEAGRLPEAIAQMQRVTRLKPDSAEAWNNLGVAFALAGRTADAREQFRRAVELAPAWSEARDNLARAERQLARP